MNERKAAIDNVQDAIANLKQQEGFENDDVMLQTLLKIASLKKENIQIDKSMPFLIRSELLHLEGILGKSASAVTWKDVAPFYGLDCTSGIEQIERIPLRRCRLPNDLFRAILHDLDLAGKVFGRWNDHRNEESRSRYIQQV